MKRIRIWMQDNTFTDITTEWLDMIVVDNKTVKIRLYDNDNDKNIIAEFYCDNICGWAQLEYVVNP